MYARTVSVLKFISIIQRNTQRYFDLTLEQCGCGFGSGQQFFLLRIYENPGITMYDLSRTGGFDKGTVTKAVQKLAEEGYVEVTVDAADKRVRRLRITQQAQAAVEELYRLRDRWIDQMTAGFTPDEKQAVFRALQDMAERSCASLQELCQQKEEEHGKPH